MHAIIQEQGIKSEDVQYHLQQNSFSELLSAFNEAEKLWKIVQADLSRGDNMDVLDVIAKAIIKMGSAITTATATATSTPSLTAAAPEPAPTTMPDKYEEGGDDDPEFSELTG